MKIGNRLIFIAISSFIQYGFKMSSAYYTEKNYNYVVYAYTTASPEDTEDFAKEQEKNLKMLTDISNLPDVGEVSINKSNVFEINMDDKHKAELTEYGKDIKARYSDSDSDQEQIDTINIISLSKNAYDAYLKRIGGDYETYKDKSPFDLSGGQKRRVAIAGVIAMNPEVLILDEPTAGLDPGGRDEIFNLIKKLHRDNNITIILSSHSMDDMAKLAQTIIVMNHGKIEFMGTPREVFTSHADKLREIGLDVPQVLELATKLRQKGFDIRPDILTVEEVKDEILKVMRGRKKC